MFQGTTATNDAVTLDYNVDLGQSGGLGSRTAEFGTAADFTGTLFFEYDYRAVHSFFEDEYTLQAFADGPNGRTVVDLFTAFDPAGFPSVQGTATLNVTSGFNYGIIVGGANFDFLSFIRGSVTLGRFFSPSNGIRPTNPAAWSSSGIAEGTTTITPATDLFYDVNLGNPGAGVSDRSAFYDVFVPTAGVLTFDYHYSLDHAFFLATANLQVTIERPDGQVTTQVLASGTTFGRSRFAGAFSPPVPAGSRVTVAANGRNVDSISILQGNVILSNIAVDPFDAADFNQDGLRNIFDILAFFAAFGA